MKKIKVLNEFGYNTSDLDRLFVGAFKLNNNYQQIRKERLANKRISIESRIYLNGYLIKVDSNKTLPLTNALQSEINNLPRNYEDNRGKYENMISTFGTHYFTQFTVGGLARASFKNARRCACAARSIVRR